MFRIIACLLGFHKYDYEYILSENCKDIYVGYCKHCHTAKIKRIKTDDYYI